MTNDEMLKATSGRDTSDAEGLSDSSAVVMCDWPTEKGIWMGKIGEDKWFPMIAKPLKEYPEGQMHLPMPIVVQFPESETRWPFTVKECHPINQWRKPTQCELIKAKAFYSHEDLAAIK